MFISGFDPRGPRHYYELWREEAPKAAATAGPGTAYHLGPPRRHGGQVFEWTLTGETRVGGETVATETRFEFLRWDDVVRRMWPRPDWSIVRSTATTLWWGVRYGYFRRIFKIRHWYLLNILEPVSTVLLILLGLPAAILLLLSLGLWAAEVEVLFALAGAPLGLFAFKPMLRWLQRTSSVLWRIQLSNFYAWQIAGQLPYLDAKLDALAARIADAAREGGVDELLVIGHSVGTTLAISALGRALARRPEDFAGVPRLAFATLGSMTPLLALEPRSAWFRDEIARIALDPAVTWVDITAAYDVACFPRIDPLELIGRERPPGAPVSPKLVSPRFHVLFGKEGYAALKQDRYQMHTQYLMATPRLGRCDFFAMVAGPLALAERFADTAPDRAEAPE
ncbi:hypothetical protein D3874_12800 [Oleomonas cavernae]|uniref:Alpha/beta hydrolase n=1 Tax=Oleomonas cavernae TaxID=2320859 RepID=A0A418WCN7_9PROT|nr:hypothetical protein D3874_12800 [Oleomonas cavernae]